MQSFSAFPSLILPKGYLSSWVRLVNVNRRHVTEIKITMFSNEIMSVLLCTVLTGNTSKNSYIGEVRHLFIHD